MPSKNSYDTADGLFPRHPEPPPQYLIANIDGGARGNPGPAGYGVLIRDQSGKKVEGLSEYLGHQTNNFAEYSGLIAALDYVLQHGPRALKVISDSELMVKQIRGQYKVKNLALQELHARAQSLIRKLDWFSIQHAFREQNQEADRLANQAMDKGMGRKHAGAAAKSAPVHHTNQEFEGVVRNGKIELSAGHLTEGTRVQIRVKK